LTPKVVGVVCALAAEARLLSRGQGPLSVGSLALSTLPDGTLLAISGMGMPAAARGARALIQAGAGALVSWGMAGGLDPRLPAGAIFLPSEVVSLEGTGLTTAPEWRQRLGEAIASRVSIPCNPMTEGRLLTSPKAIGSLADKAALFAQTRAAAVDMESLAVAETAYEHQLPFLAVRVIVDSARDALPQAVAAAADSEGHLRVWRLFGALARGPADLGPLIRLARRYRAASRSLAAIAGLGSLAPYAFATPDKDCRTMRTSTS
jgi:adenosylhomocysteine nucleosidase